MTSQKSHWVEWESQLVCRGISGSTPVFHRMRSWYQALHQNSSAIFQTCLFHWRRQGRWTGNDNVSFCCADNLNFIGILANDQFTRRVSRHCGHVVSSKLMPHWGAIIFYLSSLSEQSGRYVILFVSLDLTTVMGDAQHRHDISDNAWAILEPMLPGQPG